MPADLNRVTVVGRLTRDPVLRATAKGESVCALRIAVSSRAKDEAGEWTDRPNFFDVRVFGRQGEAAVEHLAKGRRVAVDGRLSWREWISEDLRREALEIIASDIFYIGAPKPTHPEPVDAPTEVAA